MTNQNQVDQRQMAISAMMAYYDYARYAGRNDQSQQYRPLSDYNQMSVTSDEIYNSMSTVIPNFGRTVSRDQYNTIMAGQTIVGSVNANGAQLFATRSSSGVITMAIAGTNGSDDWRSVNLGIITGTATVGQSENPLIPLLVFPPIRAEMQAYLNTVVNFFQQIHTAYPDAPIYIAGHSLGGYLGKLLRQMFPDAVTGVTTFNAPGDGGVLRLGNPDFADNVTEFQVNGNDNVQSIGDKIGRVVVLDLKSFGYTDVGTYSNFSWSNLLSYPSAIYQYLFGGHDLYRSVSILLNSSEALEIAAQHFGSLTGNFTSPLTVYRESDGIRLEIAGTHDDPPYALVVPDEGQPYLTATIHYSYYVDLYYINGFPAGNTVTYHAIQYRIPVDLSTGLPAGIVAGMLEKLPDIVFESLYSGWTAAIGGDIEQPTPDALAEIVVTARRPAYPGLSDSQAAVLADLRHSAMAPYFGPELEAALNTGDKWTAFNAFISGDRPPSFVDLYGGIDGSRSFQIARLVLAERFTPFSGEGGKPADRAEALSVLDHYDDAYVTNLGNDLVTQGLSPSDLAARLNAYFPIDTILSVPELRLDVGIIAKLDEVNSRFERIFTAITGVLFWTGRLQTGSGINIPYTPDGDFIIPLTSNYLYSADRVLTLRRRDYGILGPYGQDSGYDVLYDGRVQHVDTLAEAYAYVNSDRYRQRPDGTTTAPAEAIRVDGEAASEPEQTPGGGNMGGDDANDLPAGFSAYTALTIIATRIASQVFQVHDPVAAILVNAAVERAVDEVVFGTLTALNLADSNSSFKVDLADGLRSSVTSGITALVVNQLTQNLLGQLGVNGLPGQAFTTVVSQTASLYVLQVSGLAPVSYNIIENGESVLVRRINPSEATLGGAFEEALKSAPATILSSFLVSKIAPGNAPVQLVSSLVGSIISSLLPAAANPYGLVAALAVVTAAIVLKAFGVGPSTDGPIGKINLSVEAGRFKALAPYIKRNGFKGPAEQLTMMISGQLDTAIHTMNTALDAVGASVTGLRSKTGIRYYLKGDQYITIGTGIGGVFDQEYTTRLLINFVEQTLRFANLRIPADADPILTRALKLGWYDWVISAGDPDYRATLPQRLSFYTAYEAVLAARENLAGRSAQNANPEGSSRLHIGPDNEVLIALLGELRTVAQGIQAQIQQELNYFSYDTFDLNAQVSLHYSLYLAITAIQSAGDELGISIPSLPTDVGPYPADPDRSLTIPEQYQRYINIIEAWLQATEVPPVQTSVPMLPPPAQVVVTGLPDPAVQVTWQPVGTDETVAIRWQEGDGRWLSLDVGNAASAMALPAVKVGETYSVQAKRQAAPAADGTTRKSVWTPVQTIIVPTGVEGAQVARLELSQQGTDTTWEGRDIQINWSGLFPTATGTELQLEAITDASSNPDFRGYGVRILAADGRLLREVGPLTAASYSYRYEDNLADSRALGLVSASRQVRFEVSIIPKVGPAIGMQALTVTNAAPAKVGVVATAGLGLLSVEVTPVEDLDLDGYVIWVSDQPGFDPATTPPVYRGPSPHFAQRNLVLTDWYIRAAAVDLFQPRDGLDVAGLNLSDEVMVTLADITLDKVPPAVPTGLALSSAVGYGRGGEQTVTLTASWDRNGEDDFLIYEGQIRRGEAGDWVDFSLGLPATGRPTYVWPVEAATPYTVRLRGRDRSGNASDYGSAVTILSASDTTPPGPVTQVAADVGLRSVVLRWTNPPDLDLDMVEVYRALANDRALSVYAGAVRGSVFADQGRTPGSNCYYWLRAVDRTGNKGDWSHADKAGLAVTIPRAVADDIADAQVNFAKFAQGIEPVGLVNTLPAVAGYTGPRTVLLASDGKLYRLTAGAWTAAVAAGDVAGQLVANQIAADAITAGKIAAGAINAREIAAGAVNAGAIAANSILSSHITASAVRAEHIQAGAVTADRISVADLAAVSANLGTITAGTLQSSVVYAGQIDAGQVRAGGVLADNIRVGAMALGDIAATALDPAARINANVTTINGGKITAGSIDATAIKAGSIDTSRLKVSGRILSILGLTITFSGSTLTWGSGVIQWTDNNSQQQTTNIAAGSRGGILTGQRIRLYWELGSVQLLTTANISTNPPDDAMVLATVQPGQATPLILHYKDVIIAGNSLKAGMVNANLIKGDLIDTRELRLGVTYDGDPGLYLRTSDDYLANEVGSRAGQRTIFAYAGGRRRAQMYVTADGSDAGFEAWDNTGTQIFGSNGLGTGTVDARVIRPESATFVRSATGWGEVYVTVNIQGLPTSQQANIVLLGYGNGDGQFTNNLIHVRGPGFADTWDPTVATATNNSNDNYIGFFGIGQGTLLRRRMLGNGTYTWRLWCSDGEGSSTADIAAKVNTVRTNRMVGLVAIVSMR